MNTINVTQFLDTPSLLNYSAGVLLKKEIYRSMRRDQDVIVDFNGYTSISHIFLIAAIGQLYMELKGRFKNIKIQGLSDEDVSEMELILYNADHRLQLLKRGIDPIEFYKSRIVEW